MLCVVCCVLFDVLFGVCWLFGARCSLLVVRCSLFVVRCSLFLVRCLQFVVCWLFGVSVFLVFGV